jgi:hypothetical protein
VPGNRRSRLRILLHARVDRAAAIHAVKEVGLLHQQLANLFTDLVVLCPADNFTKSLEFGENRLGSCGPYEGLGMLIPIGHEALDLVA